MRSLLLLGAALLGVVLAECTCSGGSDEYRVGALERTIEDVEESVKELRAHWDENIAPKTDAYSLIQKNIRGKVAKLEGPACAEGKFKCDSGQCINNLLVCDGSGDCDDGSDEDDHLCAIETPAGTVLEGGIFDNDGCTKRRPHKMRIVVNYAYPVPWMPNRVKIGAAVVVRFNEDGATKTKTFNCKGYYSFGNREMVLLPPEDDRLGIVCKFNSIRHDVCEAEIVHESSGEACVRFTMKRLTFDQDPDDN